MTQYLIKILITSVLVASISEVSKRSSFVGALIASLPLTSILAMIWLHVETGEAQKIAALSSAIFWLVIPSLALFVALPLLLRAGVGFWPSLAASILVTIAAYFALLPLLARFGVTL